ncbi:serine/threonine-protein kinase [Nannocystis punicea]|uniref:Serine/threonine-protein kinase n=1 Tax=Nannocystis punicea TaxID=2995304 RepID=A0ABY7H5K1_9BACT|nr:serine/threonine-protein kinase [Nannocystis poenicansa]WAS94557.1 serine/threonine-protein kinase [Nannocystis poenicansa]
MTASESDGAGGLAAALAAPRLVHDREYARGKAAVAAALFDEPQPRPSIGRYELRRRLGAGGMGEVYAAHDPALGREVALKLTRSDRAGPGEEARLLREARLLARLSHPHVVQIHEVGAVDGHVYIAMALIRGRTLRAWQREAARPWRATVRLYVAAARGLAAAHAAGLVHCDFKPDNALVDTDEHVYVVDFGLARVAGPAPEAGTDGSPGGVGSTLGGTVGYAAPEQLVGRAPDARSDIYSLCCSLFEALHGWVPGRDPAPPARRRPEHPRWLDRELARGMAAAPERRHPTLAALCAALERDPGRTRRRIGLAGGLLALGGSAGAWLPDPPAAIDACAAVDRGLDAAWNPAQRAALAAAFRGSGLTLAAGAWQRVDASLGAYVQAWQAARRQLCETSALHSPGRLEARRICLERSAAAVAALIERLAAGERAAVERSIAAVEALPRLEACAGTGASALVSRSTGAPARDGGEALRRTLITARAYAATGDLAEARRLAESALARADLAVDPAARADALLAVGELRAERGEIEAAEAALLEAVDTAEAAGEDDLAASTWLALTTLAARQQIAPERAQLWARRAAAALDRLGDQGLRRAELEFARAIAAYHAGHHDETARLEREVLARLEAVDGPQAARIRAQQGLANAYEALGREAEARATFEAALAAADAFYGARHPQYARVAHDMATLLIQQGEGARARGLLEAALAVWTEAHGAAGLEAARVHTTLAHEAVQAGEFGRAEHHSRRALAIYGRVLPPGHEDLPAALINLGVVEFWRGDHEGALAAYREAAALQDRSLPAGHVHRAITANNIGESLLALDRPAEALAEFTAAEPIARAAPTVDDELLGLILAGKGAALLALGEADRALAALVEARAATARVAGSAAAVAELDARLSALGRAR